MSKAYKYIEQVSSIEGDDFGDTHESVSVLEAITACKLMELETLEMIVNSFNLQDSEILNLQIQKLTKQLRNIKIK